MPVAIVSGALANKPFNGGEAWVRLSWVLGLQRLGFDAYLVEQIDSAGCHDEAGQVCSFGGSVNRRWFERTVVTFGLEQRASLLCDGGSQATGLGLAELLEVAAGAELLVNISGHLTLEELLRAPRRRLYVDLDPGFTQAWHADPAVDFELGGHEHYATVGLNVGAPDCPIPTGGIEWVPTLPPVLLDRWPPAPPRASSAPLRLTSVATWRAPFGAPPIDGRPTSLKHHQLRRLIALPEEVASRAELELALDIHPGDTADREALLAHGWHLADPRVAAGDPTAFREYVGGSDGELSVAQGVYAETGSGWFSDRTAAYLASGRPALVQDTGIGAHLPPGEGLLTFSTAEQAVAGIERIAADPAAHGAAARELARQRLDSDVVLAELLTRIGVGG